MYVGTVPIVGTACYSVIRLKALNEAAMARVEEVPGGPALIHSSVVVEIGNLTPATSFGGPLAKAFAQR